MLFCSLKRGFTPKIRALCFVVMNSVLFNLSLFLFFMRLDLIHASPTARNSSLFYFLLPGPFTSISSFSESSPYFLTALVLADVILAKFVYGVFAHVPRKSYRKLFASLFLWLKAPANKFCFCIFCYSCAVSQRTLLIEHEFWSCLCSWFMEHKLCSCLCSWFIEHEFFSCLCSWFIEHDFFSCLYSWFIEHVFFSCLYS